jgi:hypothetical protein
MGLPARPVPGMAFVAVGFVDHVEALRGESLGQLLHDEIAGVHGCPLRQPCVSVNATQAWKMLNRSLSRLEAVTAKRAY